MEKESFSNRLEHNQEKIIKSYYNSVELSHNILDCQLENLGVSKFTIVKESPLRKMEVKNDINIDMWIGTSIENFEERNLFLSGILCRFPFIRNGVILHGFEIQNLYHLQRETI